MVEKKDISTFIFPVEDSFEHLVVNRLQQRFQKLDDFHVAEVKIIGNRGDRQKKNIYITGPQELIDSCQKFFKDGSAGILKEIYDRDRRGEDSEELNVLIDLAIPYEVNDQDSL